MPKAAYENRRRPSHFGSMVKVNLTARNKAQDKTKSHRVIKGCRGGRESKRQERSSFRSYALFLLVGIVEAAPLSIAALSSDIGSSCGFRFPVRESRYNLSAALCASV